MKKILIIIANFMLCISCQNDTSENIILTSGLSSNPSTPRFGIEINSKYMYYCEEKLKEKGKYNYFQGEMNPQIFKDIQSNLILVFDNTNESEDINDATRYELIYKNNSDMDTVRFYKYFLNNKQLNVLEKIELLKKSEFKKISYHQFPNALLTYKLPTPPPLILQRKKELE